MAEVTQPDEQQILDYRRHLEGVWSAAHAHWSGKVDPWYWRFARIWSAESGRSSFIPSTARAIVDHAADTHMAFEPKFTRNPVGKGKKHEEQADEVEAALHAIFIDAMLHEPSVAFYQIGKYLGTYGYAVVEGPLLDFEDKPKEPVKRKGETNKEFRWREIDYENAKKYWNPIRIRAPHPKQVLLDPFHKQPKEGVKFTKIGQGRIRKLMESLEERERKPDFVAPIEDVVFTDGNPFDALEVTEYWSDEWHSMVVGNRLAFVERNLYGFVPFNHAFSGFGQEMSGDDQHDPFYLAQGLLDPLLDTANSAGALKVQAQSFSAKHTAVIERAYLRMRVPPGREDEVREQLSHEDGVVGAEKDEVDFINYPEIERGLFQIDQQVGEDIEMGTFARLLAGIRPAGVSTVGQHAQLSVAAGKKFAVVHKQIDLIGTVLGMNMLRLIDRLEEPVSAAGKTLSPSLIHNDYNITAEFPVLDPVIHLQNREQGLMEVQAGVKSRETYRTDDLRVADETKEKKRLIKERVRDLPAYFEVVAQQVAKEDGMEGALTNMDGEAVLGPNGQPIETPEISDQAGGGGPRGLRQGLNNETQNPPRLLS